MANSKLLKSSIAKKYLMALTGLFLVVFLIEHLYGNLLLLKPDGGAAFNEYSHNMTTNILIRIVEVVLFLGILAHVVNALRLTMENKKARPVKYAMDKPSANSSWFSRNMGLTGSIILVFIIVHLSDYFFEYRIEGLDGNETVYDEVIESFQQLWYVILYIVGFIFLGFHLNHAIQSSFQTLGINHPKYNPLIKKTGAALAFIITLGFTFIPLYIYFTMH